MISKIVVPTDGSAHAMKAVELAADLAAKYGAQMVILHALLRHASGTEIRALSDRIALPEDMKKRLEEWEGTLLEASAAAYGAGPIHIALPEEILKEVADLITKEAHDAAEARGVGEIKIEIADASPANFILAAAEQEKADMIVMGSRGLGTFQGLLVGSVSHRVNHLASCTCVTVK